jgi:hypothetical protein
MTKLDNEDREWRISVYENLIADPRVQAIAMQVAESSRERGDPEVNLGNTAAARKYLLRCIMNMTVVEVSTLDVATAGGLWGRGAIGAARWRARNFTRPGPRRIRPAGSTRK